MFTYKKVPYMRISAYVSEEKMYVLAIFCKP